MSSVVITATDTPDGVVIVADWSRDVLTAPPFTKAEELALGMLGGLPDDDLACVRRRVNGVDVDGPDGDEIESRPHSTAIGGSDGRAGLHE